MGKVQEHGNMVISPRKMGFPWDLWVIQDS